MHFGKKAVVLLKLAMNPLRAHSDNLVAFSCTYSCASSQIMNDTEERLLSILAKPTVVSKPQSFQNVFKQQPNTSTKSMLSTVLMFVTWTLPNLSYCTG